MSSFDPDITSANAEIILKCDELFPNGIKLEKFSTDAAAVADSVDSTETRMGVDGHMAAGVTPNITPLTITLEANSPSNDVLETIKDAYKNNKRLYAINITIKIPSRNKTWNYINGVLKSGTTMPGLNKVLSPTTWVFHFETCDKN